MTRLVHAPLDGVVIDLSEVPDSVFSGEIVGPGLAIAPSEDDECVEVRAPVGGQVSSAHPHAFVISTPTSPPILTHLGIDTVKLSGEGFSPHIEVGQVVRVAELVSTWNLGPTQSAGLSPVVPVIVLDPNAHIDTLIEAGARVFAGDPIIRIHP